MTKLVIGTKLYSFQQFETEDGREFRLVEATVCSVTESISYPEGEVAPVDFHLEGDNWKNNISYGYELVDSLNTHNQSHFAPKGYNTKYCINTDMIGGLQADHHSPEWFFTIEEVFAYEREKFEEDYRIRMDEN
jgi:hypothetical protein